MGKEGVALVLMGVRQKTARNQEGNGLEETIFQKSR